MPAQLSAVEGGGEKKLDIFEQYASSNEAPANDSPTSGLAELNAALLKAETRQIRTPFEGDDPQNPLPSWAEDQERHRKYSEAIKQRNDDLRVVSEAIRSGASVPLTGQHDAKQRVVEQSPDQAGQPAKIEHPTVWKTSAGIRKLIKGHFPKLNRILDSPGDFEWLERLNLRRPNPSRKNGWEYDYYGVLEKLRKDGDFYGEIPDPNQGTIEPDPIQATTLYGQLAVINGKSRKSR